MAWLRSSRWLFSSALTVCNSSLSDCSSSFEVCSSSLLDCTSSLTEDSSSFDERRSSFEELKLFGDRVQPLLRVTQLRLKLCDDLLVAVAARAFDSMLRRLRQANLLEQDQVVVAFVVVARQRLNYEVDDLFAAVGGD